MNIEGGVPAPADLAAGGEDALIVRPRAEVEARNLPDGGFAFIEALWRGDTVLTATKDAVSACADFDIAANLSGLLGAGAVIGFVRHGNGA